MNNNYVIQWKSKINGRAGRGTKQFTLDEAEQLVSELNREYPQIEHEVIPAPPPAPRNEADPALPEDPAAKPNAEAHARTREHTQVFTTE